VSINALGAMFLASGLLVLEKHDEGTLGFSRTGHHLYLTLLSIDDRPGNNV
jgi:hypothetical protein